MRLIKFKKFDKADYILLVIAIIFAIIFMVQINRKKCEYDGSTYFLGDQFQSNDSCSSCACAENGIICSLNQCTYNTPLGTDNNSNAANVRLYFIQTTQNTDNTTNESLYAIKRISDKKGLDLISYILTQIIAGPTVSEKHLGFTQLFQLSETSTCNNKFFNYTIDKTKLTVKICKTMSYKPSQTSLIYDAISNSILINISNIDTVILRDKDNQCFGTTENVNQDCN